MSAKIFSHENFLLSTEAAERLYHNYAKDLPIIDYHCHLPPADIAEDKRFANLAQIWLYGDHYKWRAMRTNGVAEHFCTGDASDWEKFSAWAETVPHTLRNPLYHWTHLELNRPFGINDRLLNPDTAPGIWDICNEKLAAENFSARGIIQQMNVEVICTTDDPCDTLEHHLTLAADTTFAVKVFPTWRPDKAMAVEDTAAFNAYVEKLAVASKVEINAFSSFIEAIDKRHEFFHAQGCRLSDHGLETFYGADFKDSDCLRIFSALREGIELSPLDILTFKSAMLYYFGVMDHTRGWVQQYHVGALRNQNTRLFKALGADTGFDSMGDFSHAHALGRMLDRLDREDKLAKTIIYNHNPSDNDVFATMIGNFQDGSVAGKIQFGSGWWFLDQKDGMEKQLNSLSNHSLLSRFVGMLTDSRSFLSYTRHEYFRRILCNLLGGEMESGLIPNDEELVGEMVKNICYGNAREYFDFGLANAPHSM